MESDSEVSVKDYSHLRGIKLPSRKGIKLGSRTTAIHEFCKECIYDEHSGFGTWRQQTGACPMTKCQLYPFRPTSRPHKDTGDNNDN